MSDGPRTPTKTDSGAIFTPPVSPATPAKAPSSTAPSSTQRATLSSRLSLAPEDLFGREPECGVCTKSFNILRRRHHCRGCHIAVCKDCGRKAVDRKKSDRARPQWYCMSCLDEDPTLEIAGSRPAYSKRRSFSASPFAPSAPQVTNVRCRVSLCVYFVKANPLVVVVVDV